MRANAEQWEGLRQDMDRWRRAAQLPPLVDEAFGEEVRRLRTQRGLSLRSFATAAGISPTFVSLMENGHRSPPAEQTIRRMADVLGADDYALLLTARKLPSELVTALLHQTPAELRELAGEIVGG